MAFGATSRAPHGGIWVVGLIGKPASTCVAIVIGIVVGAVCVCAAKTFRRHAIEVEDEPVAEATVVPGVGAAVTVRD